MCCCGNDAEFYLSFRYYGVHDDRAEYVVVLPHVVGELYSVVEAAFHEYGGYGCVGGAEIEAPFTEAVL